MDNSEEFEVEVGLVRVRRKALAPGEFNFQRGDENENQASLSERTKSSLQRLGRLYGDEEISSPVHRSEERFHVEESDDRKEKTVYSEERSKRFKMLASTINSWEDDLKDSAPSKDPSPVKNQVTWSKGVEKRGVWSRTGASPKKIEEKTPKKIEPKSLASVISGSGSNIETTPNTAWDNRIISKLESQGFKKCDSQEHLVYDYKTPESNRCLSPRRKLPEQTRALEPAAASPQRTILKPVENTRTKSPVKTVVQEMAAQIMERETPLAKPKDPAFLSVREKLAVFEKNKGFLPLPQEKTVVRSVSPRRPLPVTVNNNVTNEPPVKHSVNQALLERMKEIEDLKHRWDKNKAVSFQVNEKLAESDDEVEIPEKIDIPEKPSGIPPPPPLPSSPPKSVSEWSYRAGGFSPQKSPPQPKMGTKVSPKRQNSPDRLPRVLSCKEKSPNKGSYPQVKRIRVSPVKDGHIYPSISDIEESESDYPPVESSRSESSMAESDESLTSTCTTPSLGQEIVRQASKVNLKRDSSSLSEESRVLREMDELLEEAMFETEQEEEEPRNKISRPEPSTPLVHTVSMYRKQQMTITPKAGNHKPDTSYEAKRDAPEIVNKNEDAEIEERIKYLQTEVKKQLETIGQASKALSLCQAQPQFIGSAAEIEAQKLLLISKTRYSCINEEIERLKIERRLGAKCDGRGDVCVSSFRIPLKTSRCAESHVIIVLRSGARVLTTELSQINEKSKSEGCIKFEKSLTLSDLSSDFTASIEVFAYTPKTPPLTPHHSKALTPSKKDKKNKERLGSYFESPAGPNAVRSTSFESWGFALFSLKEISRTSFTLNKVPSSTPLKGSLELKITSSVKSDIEFSGWLTLYEDVRGFGAWKRRWSKLSGATLSFWLYPEEERQGQVPLDSIDLRHIITEEASLAPRHLCARPHTILMRSRLRDTTIRESHVAVREGDTTLLTHLLSADTKEERLEWSTFLNKTLKQLRSWGVTS